MSEVDDDGVVTSLLSGEQCAVEAGRFVDATHSKMQVPVDDAAVVRRRARRWPACR